MQPRSSLKSGLSSVANTSSLACVLTSVILVLFVCMQVLPTSMRTNAGAGSGAGTGEDALIPQAIGISDLQSGVGIRGSLSSYKLQLQQHLHSLQADGSTSSNHEPLSKGSHLADTTKGFAIGEGASRDQLPPTETQKGGLPLFKFQGRGRGKGKGKGGGSGFPKDATAAGANAVSAPGLPLQSSPHASDAREREREEVGGEGEGEEGVEQRGQRSSSSGSAASQAAVDLVDSANNAKQQQQQQQLQGDTDVEQWASVLSTKLRCLRGGGSGGSGSGGDANTGTGGIFLYHIRKAAGTSMRDVLEQASHRWHVPLFESEGLSLDWRFLTFKNGISNNNGGGGGDAVAKARAASREEWKLVRQNQFPPKGAVGSWGTGTGTGSGTWTGSLLSVITLRNPIDRILSLYWYEHVGWFDGIQHKPEKCATLRQWVDYWKDGSATKTNFMKANPASVYVEIENYFVKSLIGWQGPTSSGSSGSITDEHLRLAKQVLQAFDLVLLTEWMADASQIDTINSLFPGRAIIATKQLVKGDKKAKERLQGRLSPPAEEAEILSELRVLNKLDLELFSFAESLVAQRLARMPRIISKLALSSLYADGAAGEGERRCGARLSALPNELGVQLGIHRPPKHKAPLL